MQVHKLCGLKRLLVIIILIANSCYWCVLASEDFYPVGICGVQNRGSLSKLHQAGFNFVLGSASKEFLDSAAENGIKVWASPGSQAGTNYNKSEVRKVVQQWDKHKALWGWFLADEPEMQSMPPEQVKEAQKHIKSIGARKPTSIVLFQGAESLHYGNLADIIFCDRYPIPWLPLSNYNQHLSMVRLALGKKRALIAIIQAFDWSYYSEMLGIERLALRAPTKEEIRCMTYLALANGAKGLIYYTYDDGPGRWRMDEHPDTWSSLCDLIVEIKKHLPLFKAEHLWWPKKEWYEEPEKMFNASLQSSVCSVLLNVKKGNDNIPPGKYLLTVNTTDQDQKYSLFVGNTERMLPVIGEKQAKIVDDGWVCELYRPYEVHIYGPMKISKRTTANHVSIGIYCNKSKTHGIIQKSVIEQG